MATSNCNGTAREQLWVCWLEPQSDSGKVSAIPVGWVAQTVSGDGRSPDSVVRCRWPRTKKLYRARIVAAPTLAELPPQQKSKPDSGGGGVGVGGGGGGVKPGPNCDNSPAFLVADHQQQQQQQQHHQHRRQQLQQQQQQQQQRQRTPSENDEDDEDDDDQSPTDDEDVPDADANSIDDNNDDEDDERRTAKSEQQQPPVAAMVKEETSSRQASVVATAISAVPSPVAAPTSDAVSLAQALLPTLKKIFNNELAKLSTDIQANFDIIGHKISALDGTVKGIKTRVDRMETLLNTAAQELDESSNGAVSPPGADLLAGAVRSLGFGGQMRNDRGGGGGGTFHDAKPQSHQHSGQSTSRSAQSIGNASTSRVGSLSSSAAGNVRPSLADLHQKRLPTRPMVDHGGFSVRTPNFLEQTVAAVAAAKSGAAKRRRTAATTNPPLPKAVVISAPNGFEIYLGGNSAYKMPLVMYKDALKNCTRPSATYMVMALIRRYLTPDEMSRTWLTEQQLLGKNDGILLDQNLLAALKKQAIMQFPGSGIDDRLLIRKLYDVFHGIRRQLRKKKRKAGENDGYGNDTATSGAGLGTSSGGDAHSGSADDQDELDDESHQYGQIDLELGDEMANDDMMDEEDAANLSDGAIDDGELDSGEDDGLMGDEGVLNGDEDLEQIAAKRAAFWAGADDDGDAY